MFRIVDTRIAVKHIMTTGVLPCICAFSIGFKYKESACELGITESLTNYLNDESGRIFIASH